MAHQQVYICDYCDSYVDGSELHIIKVSIDVAPTCLLPQEEIFRTHVPYDNRAIITVVREICPACAQLLLKNLKLNERDADINNRAFKNFKPLNDPTT